jgi:predicted nucleotidyltransferase
MSETMLEPTDELKALAHILADWAEDVTATIYLYGSRVRSDHRLDSDVDIHVAWSAPDNLSTRWWCEANDDLFATINGRLPGPLQILEPRDPLHYEIEVAPVVYQDRNVRCVFLKPKR